MSFNHLPFEPTLRKTANSDYSGRRSEVIEKFQDFQRQTEVRGNEFINREQVLKNGIEDARTASETCRIRAYTHLESIVSILLTLEEGNKRLSSGSTVVLETLAEATDSFDQFCKEVDTEAKNFGISARDFMQWGDETDNFISEIEAWKETLRLEKNSMEETRRELQSEFDRLASDRDGHYRRVLEARERRDDVLNSIASFFSSDVENDLRWQVNNAEEILNRNVSLHSEYGQKLSRASELLTALEETDRDIESLKIQLQDISRQYDDNYKLISDSRDQRGDVWKGLLLLKDNICAPDYRSTRDNSLRAVLELLAEDDKVFEGDAFVEGIQAQIHDHINGRLGDGAVERLKAPIAISLEQFEIEWPGGFP